MNDALKVPSPFYRVAAKALIFDDQQRLLLAYYYDHVYGIPGGGWEHDESFEDCLRRELGEELEAKITKIGPIVVTYRAPNWRGHMQLRLAAVCKLAGINFHPGDDVIDTLYVTKAEFLTLRYAKDDLPVDQTMEELADKIWQQVEK